MPILTTPLRYPGGKAKALKKILPIIPNNISEYREPFLGGGSVFVSIKQNNPSLFCRINDLNAGVSSFWRCLKENPNHLINAIIEIKNNTKDGKSLYCKLKKNQPNGLFARALRFYILNRITYSGTVDSGGYSSESFYKRFTHSQINKLSDLSKTLTNVEITNKSYQELVLKKGKGVFIFLDPPYWKQRNFPIYGKKGHLNKFFDHELFASNLKMCKHKWLVTCDDCELIRRLFTSNDIFITPWEMVYSGLNKKKGAIKGKELFITNYNIEDMLVEKKQ